MTPDARPSRDHSGKTIYGCRQECRYTLDIFLDQRPPILRSVPFVIEVQYVERSTSLSQKCDCLCSYDYRSLVAWRSSAHNRRCYNYQRSKNSTLPNSTHPLRSLSANLSLPPVAIDHCDQLPSRSPQAHLNNACSITTPQHVQTHSSSPKRNLRQNH